MPARIVTISHASGAGGESIGREVADRLRFRYIDEEIVSLAAAKEGVDAAVIADAERRKGLLERIIANFASAQATAAAGVGAYWDPERELTTSDPLYALVIDAIRETAQRGEVVIVAHAASIPLAGSKGLLRVLITASTETRVQRLAEGARRGTSEAAKLVKRSDAGRADYFQRFYGIERELPTHYDLVINTDVLTLDDAADIVVHAARRRP
jgi:cytidylate kinase